jgi:flagellar protein FlbD
MRWGLKRRDPRADARPVIELHRIHGNGTFVVNADLIETIEACPDTIVTLVTKRRFVVEDAVQDVIDRVIAYRSRCNTAIAAQSDHASGARGAWLASDEEQAA